MKFIHEKRVLFLLHVVISFMILEVSAFHSHVTWKNIDFGLRTTTVSTAFLPHNNHPFWRQPVSTRKTVQFEKRWIANQQSSILFPTKLSSLSEFADIDDDATNDEYSDSDSLIPIAQYENWNAYLDSDNTGFIYYFNTDTSESQWERPTDFPKIDLSNEVRDILKGKQIEYIQLLEEQLEVAKTQQQLYTIDLRNLLFSDAATIKDEENVTLFEGNASVLEENVGGETAIVTTTDLVNLNNAVDESKSKQNDWLSSILDNLNFKNNLPFNDETTLDQLEEPKGKDNAMINEMETDLEDTEKEKSTSEIELTSEQEEKLVFFSNLLSIDNDGLVANLNANTIEDEKYSIPVRYSFSILPHPAKISWGGEDALCVIPYDANTVTTTSATFGVFDGVSGAEKEEGVPLYSQFLADELYNSVLNDSTNSDKLNEESADFVDYSLSMEKLTNNLLQAAELADDNATGASTAIVGSINSLGIMNVLNVGDSKCIVLRPGSDDNTKKSFHVAHETSDIIHYFECPYQLSIDSPDRPRDGTKLSNIQLNLGDVVVIGSDGIFDNLFTENICDIVSNGLEQQMSGSEENNDSEVTLAQMIATEARNVSLTQNARTPYSTQAQSYGNPDFESGLGGKVDDIGCIVIQYGIV